VTERPESMEEVVRLEQLNTTVDANLMLLKSLMTVDNMTPDEISSLKASVAPTLIDVSGAPYTSEEASMPTLKTEAEDKIRGTAVGTEERADEENRQLKTIIRLAISKIPPERRSEIKY